VVKLNLKFKKGLSTEKTANLVARAKDLARGSVQPVFPDKLLDKELATFYSIDAINPSAAAKAHTALKKMAGVAYVEKPKARKAKTSKSLNAKNLHKK